MSGDKFSGCIWTFWDFSLILIGSVPRGIVSCYGVKDICQRGRIELENEGRQKCTLEHCGG